jgi:flagellar motor switch protein FliN/FliY
MADDVEQGELPEIDESIVAAEGERGATKSKAPAASDLGLIMEVPLRLSVELGSTTLPVREVLALTKGSVLVLNRMSGEPADIYVNERLIARGELITQEDRVAIRITELIASRSGSDAR